MKGGRPKLSPYGICRISIAFVRQLPSHKSYLVTQVLFGEYVKIISKKNKDWFRIECLWDGVIGWIDPKQFHVLKDKQLGKMQKECKTFTLDHLHGLNSSSSTIPISIGSNLPHCDGINVKLPFGQFQYHGQIVNTEQFLPSKKLLLNITKRYLHCPYLYGGRSILGLDASGFTQVVYKLMGCNLPRSCDAQALEGEDIGFRSQAKPGDLAFFENDQGQIDHVGILLEEESIMHVYGQVRLDKLDQEGIFDLQKKKYIYKLRTIRRVVNID